MSNPINQLFLFFKPINILFPLCASVARSRFGHLYFPILNLPVLGSAEGFRIPARRSFNQDGSGFVVRIFIKVVAFCAPTGRRCAPVAHFCARRCAGGTKRRANVRQNSPKTPFPAQKHKLWGNFMFVNFSNLKSRTCFVLRDLDFGFVKSVLFGALLMYFLCRLGVVSARFLSVFLPTKPPPNLHFQSKNKENRQMFIFSPRCSKGIPFLSGRVRCPPRPGSSRCRRLIC